MVRAIMVQMTGDASDEPVLGMAYLTARLFHAHIEAVLASPSWAEFAASMAAQNLDAALSPVDEIESFEAQAKAISSRARNSFEAFRARWDIPEGEAHGAVNRVTAAWREVEGAADRVIIGEARFYDLTVAGRAPGSALDSLVLRSGRPVVIAPAKAPENLAPTIAIAWKDSADAARAVTAAMPLLARASKVIVIGADEGGGPEPVIESLRRLAGFLAWHGIAAETHCADTGGRSTAETIVHCAQGNGADLLVMGAYGHSRIREFILGGATQDMIRDCALPVFQFH